jgi:low affinity Fe/Cu permease
MSLASSSPRQVFASLLIVVLAAAVISTGCGASGSMAKTPPLIGNTAVTVVVSSMANVFKT